MSCCTGPIVADYAIARQSTHRVALLQELQLKIRQVSDGSGLLVSIPSIQCGNFISSIENRIRKLLDVKNVRANLALKRVSLEFDSSNQTLSAIVDKLEDIGFPPQSLVSEEGGEVDLQLTLLVRALAV